MNLKLNSDLGEGAGNDALLMPYLFACNIACGGHYGDASTIQTAVQLALKHGVKIGAHPSYPDKDNFGRKSMDIKSSILIQSLQDQLALFNQVLLENDTPLFHIKAHGALYNDIAKSEILAQTYLSIINSYKEKCLLFVPDHSAIKKLALEQGFQIYVEAFADRNYLDDGQLVPRSHPQAIIHQPEKAVQHVYDMMNSHQVITVGGKKITLQANTFCIHGDHKNAVAIAQALHQTFNQKKTTLE